MDAFSIHADDEDAGPPRCDQAFLSRMVAETHVNADGNEELHCQLQINMILCLIINILPVFYRTRATLNRIQNETPERLLLFIDLMQKIILKNMLNKCRGGRQISWRILVFTITLCVPGT